MSAAVVVDEQGYALVVRKRGTAMFQQPGGKPDPGETAVQALVRELHEEIGVVVAEADLEPLGTFRDWAANEPGHTVIGDAFAVRVRRVDVVAASEIEEVRWLTESDVPSTPLANLSRNHLLRFAWR